jgi:hypothetical protein
MGQDTLTEDAKRSILYMSGDRAMLFSDLKESRIVVMVVSSGRGSHD